MRWNWLKHLGNTRSARRPHRLPSYRPTLEALEVRVVPSADVLTYHNDLARTGANLGETILTPSNVDSTHFGKLFTYSVDGQVYASVLYKSNVTVPDLGTFNVAYVATEHDSVYAFDTDSNSSGPNHDGILWMKSFLGTGVSPFSQADAYGCSQITPEIGITATPVIDPTSNTIYVVAQTKEVVGTTTTYHQKLHALDIATGDEKFGGPVEITASVAGTGDGGTTVTFHAQDYKERPGLVLLNGVIYTSWASHCDHNPNGRAAHGWVIGYDASNLTQTSVFCTSPNGSLDTIWQGNGSLAADSAGNLYFETGNGSSGPSNSNYSEAFLKLSTTGGVLSVADYFIPANYATLDQNDTDIGSGAPIALPDQPGDHTHLLVGAGKDGRIFLVDRDNMGGLNNPPNGPDLIVQELAADTIQGGSWDTPAYFDSGSDGNRWIYYAGSGDHLKAFSLTNGLLSTSPTSQSSASFGYPGATPIVSANGTSNAIVWVVQQGSSTAILRAYDATDLTTELYDSNQAGTRDQLDASVKFATPTLADGKVFVGTNDTLTIFGLWRPILAPIPDQTITSDQPAFDLPLTVSNPGGFATSFSASADQPHATFSFAGSTLTVTPESGFTGTLVVTVTVDNNHGTDTKTFNFTVTTGPALSGIADNTISSSQQSLDVALTVANPGGNTLTYSATAQSLAYVLTQQTGTLTYDNTQDNSGGRGEKWLQAASGQWYFILPNGEIDIWNGVGGANGTSVGNVGASFYGDPTRLTNPPADTPHATFSFAGSTLTVTRDLDWTSTLVITVTVSDGSQSDSKAFDVFVTP